jgi:hypothetical protein
MNYYLINQLLFDRMTSGKILQFGLSGCSFWSEMPTGREKGFVVLLGSRKGRPTSFCPSPLLAPTAGHIAGRISRIRKANTYFSSAEKGRWTDRR